MEARALSEDQAKAHAMTMEVSNEMIQDFVRGMGHAVPDNRTLAEKSPRTMQVRGQFMEDGDHYPTDKSHQQIEGPVETHRNEANTEAEETEQTEAQVENGVREGQLRASEDPKSVPEPNKRGSTTMIEKGRAETYGEDSMTAEEKTKIKDREAKEQAKKENAMAREERKLKEKQTKEMKQRAQLSGLMEEARRKSPKPEIRENGTISEPSIQAGPEQAPMPEAESKVKYLKRPKNAKAEKWKVDSAQMKEDMEHFLEGIKALENKQREQERQEAEEATAILSDNANIIGWKAVLKELSQTTSFSAATASLSASQLSVAPRMVVRAILRRAAKIEYKNQLQVLKDTYNYRVSLLKQLKLDMKSNYKSEARELHSVYKQIRPPKF